MNSYFDGTEIKPGDVFEWEGSVGELIVRAWSTTPRGVLLAVGTGENEYPMSQCRLIRRAAETEKPALDEIAHRLRELASGPPGCGTCGMTSYLVDKNGTCPDCQRGAGGDDPEAANEASRAIESLCRALAKPTMAERFEAFKESIRLSLLLYPCISVVCDISGEDGKPFALLRYDEWSGTAYCQSDVFEFIEHIESEIGDAVLMGRAVLRKGRE